jgi:ribonuclease Z
MDRVVILGTSSAISDQDHENSHLIIQVDERLVLIDCPGNPIVRIKKAQIDPLKITDLILTHFHPDHVSGLPLLLMDLWLMGRKDPLTIYGLGHTIDRAEKMMQLFEWHRWPDFFPVNFMNLGDNPLNLLMEDAYIRIISSPVKHLIPTIGIRVEFKKSRKIFTYTSDTEPCQNLLDLAKSADVLLHEAAGDSVGHSSGKQCGLNAATAGVNHLYLTHYHPQKDINELLQEAQSTFSRPVTIAQDLMEIIFN